MSASDILLRDGIDSPLEFLREFRFSLSHIPTEITVRFYRLLGGRGVTFRQSHFIKTPTQTGEYETSRPGNDTEERALSQVVLSFLDFYNEAVQAGHEPDESWLVPNERF